MVKIAYQLYSARDAAEKDLGKVLREIAALGYEGVEFAGFHGRSADEVAALLDESGLEAVSSHVPFEDILKDPSA
jgi:sugar phosphate isomerase/epimerase